MGVLERNVIFSITWGESMQQQHTIVDRLPPYIRKTAVGLLFSVLSAVPEGVSAQDQRLDTTRQESQSSVGTGQVILNYDDSYIQYDEVPSFETLQTAIDRTRLDSPDYAILSESYHQQSTQDPFIESIIDIAQENYHRFLDDTPQGTTDLFSYLYLLRQDISLLEDADEQLSFDFDSDKILYTREDHLQFYSVLDEFLNQHGYFINVMTAPLADGETGLSVYVGEMAYEKTEIIPTMEDIVVSDVRFVRNLALSGYYLERNDTLATSGWTDFYKKCIYVHLDDYDELALDSLQEFRAFRNYHETEHISQYLSNDFSDLYQSEHEAITANLALTDHLEHELNRIYRAYYDRRGFDTEPYRSIYETIITRINQDLGYTQEDIYQGTYEPQEIRSLANVLYEVD
jgi:hypothetical protein